MISISCEFLPVVICTDTTLCDKGCYIENLRISYPLPKSHLHYLYTKTVTALISTTHVTFIKRIGKFLTSMHRINFENDLVKLVMQARYISKLHQPGPVFLVR
jgi:hypothetical protein